MRFLDTLRQPPAPLMRGERIAFIAAAIVAAGSRFLARGHSMWDWDEALFCLGVREYNVVQHNPHPPGYPLFVGAAKLVRLAVDSDFRALQIVVMLSGAALLPLLVFFAREARFPFATALGGALIFVFLPNVWIYSGSAMSDVPSLALTLLACALLLRGCRSRAAYLGGAAALALAIGIRPQALIVALACGAIATVVRWRDGDRRSIAAAAILGAVIAGGIYLGAAAAGEPVSRYAGVVREQSDWVRRVDSYHNPNRTPLRDLAAPFFYRPVAANAVQIVSILAALGAILGIATRRMPVLIALATFGPFAVFAWMMLDASAVSRYAIGYMPLHALLAADLWSAALPRRFESGGFAAALRYAPSLLLAASLAWWTWPATKAIRANDAPPIAAIRWVLRNAYPGAGTLFVHNGYRPFAGYFLRAYEPRFFETTNDIPLAGYIEPGWILGAESHEPGAHRFERPRGRLWRIVRPRYFEASVLPAWTLVHFGRGWHDAEGERANTWRWMARSSETLLPPASQRGRLTLNLYVPLDGLAAPPTVEVYFNGALVDRFAANTETIEKSWTVPSRSDAPNELRLTTSDAVVPGRSDTRELGLKLLAIRWQPAND